MDVIIWGTGAKGREVKELCEKKNWKVRGFADNDKTYWGRAVFEKYKVFSPMDLDKECAGDVQIWIAAEAPEVYEQAKKIHNNVLGWEFVNQLLKASEQKKNWPEIGLADINIKNCRLAADRREFLKKFCPESSHWNMAEVGVAFGNFSQLILEICRPQKLYLIDIWDENTCYSDGYSMVNDKFKKEIQDGTVEIRRGYSVDRLKEFKNGELDWIYIDTVHDNYEITKRELELSDKIVAPNGYICGHDYAKYDVGARQDYCIYDAVNEFAVNYGYEFIWLTLQEHGLNSFCLRKY